MTSAAARSLAVAAVLAALATVAACGGGGAVQQSPAETTEATGTGGTGGTGTTETGGQEGQGEIFVGSDDEPPSARAVSLGRTRPDEPVQGTVEVRGAQTSTPLQGIVAEIEGQNLPLQQTCRGEVPPEGCVVTFRYTPTRPGPYAGQLTVTLADGSTVVAPITGEAVGGETPTPSSAGPTTASPGPTDTDAGTGERTPEELTDVPTDVPTSAEDLLP